MEPVMKRTHLVSIAAAIAALIVLPGVRPSDIAARGQAAVQGAPPQPQGGEGGGGRGGGRGGGVARKRVLAWADTRNGQAQHESVSHALSVIERLGYESGQWDTFIRTDSNIISKTPKKTD